VGSRFQAGADRRPSGGYGGSGRIMAGGWSALVSQIWSAHGRQMVGGIRFWAVVIIFWGGRGNQGLFNLLFWWLMGGLPLADRWGRVPLPAAFSMHILYLDDSGAVKNASDRHIILAGLAVFERQPHWLSERLDQLAAQLWPDNPSALEFRGSDILGGKKFWRGIGKSERADAYRKALENIGVATSIVWRRYS
jgi:hypothetical protein